MLFFGMAADIKPKMKLTRSLSARLRISKLSLSPLAAAALAMTLTHAEAAVSYSLADDFSITANGGSNPWSYGYDNVAGEPVQFGALTSNSRNANQLWNTDFASPPTMWSDATGYWGIGKNTSGVARTSSSGITWNPNEVLLRPKATGPFPGRLVIGWTAPTGPASNVVNVTCTFARALAAGNVGYSLVKRASGVDTVLVGWTGSTSGGVLSNSLTGLMVMPGDQLFWRIDSWGPAVEDDITKAAISITPLEYQTPPVIITQPVGGTLFEGFSYTLTVLATNVQAYQWWKNGSPIAGATAASYTITNLQAINAGTYSVLLTNPLGSVISADAILNVVPGTVVSAYSLADDFSITANGGSNPWSYGYDNVGGEPVQFGALTSNSRNANQLWNTDFASPPTMWSDATGYWGIGKNTSGVVKNSSSGITWNPNEVLLRPKATGPFPGRLVIRWTAPTGPASNVVNVTYTFQRALAAGGVGYSLVKRASGVDTFLVGWTGTTSGGVLSNSLTGLTVLPGDQLFWRIDSWGTAVEDDITKATIEVEIDSFYSVEAWSPTPEHGAKVLHESAASLALGWNAGDGAVQHDLYFGTNATAVANATPADVSGIYQGRQAGLSFLPGTLDASTLYYWRVDEVDAESGVVTGAVWSFEITAELRDLYADTWVAIDGLDRVLPGVEECGPPRADKLVFMFYLSWLGGHGTDGPYDLTKLLADNPTDPALGPRHSFHHWGEPEVGYYTSKDEWVMRRHIHYLSDAGVDVLILDATNGFTYDEEYMLLFRIMRQLKYQGEKVPQIVFWTHSGSPATVTSLYNKFYANGYYEDLWSYRDGKPLHLGFPDGADGDPSSVSQEIRDFFSWREFWLLQQGSKWGTDDYPQVYGWDISPDKPTQASVVVGSQATRNMGQSFHNFTSPALDVYGLPVNGTEGHGLTFIEQFDRVLQLDPEIVTVFRWNEWVAQRFIAGLDGFPNFLGNPTVGGDSFFVDCYNAEFNSDIEPMKGGYTDNYYYQFIDYVRQYKGVRTPQPASYAKTISIDGNFSDWADVQPEFRDHVSDTTHRNCQGWGSAGIYTNATGRNDLLTFKVARDASNIYFYAETAEPMTSHTDTNWMLLFIDADQDHATGWEGYDYLVNRQVNSSNNTTLMQTTGGWNWTTASADISYMASGNKLEICVPRSLIGQGSGDDPVAFDFHWADNIQADDDIIEFGISGDSAPNRRFNYRYQTPALVATTLRSNGFETGVPYGDWEITSTQAYSGTHALECSEDDNVGIYESLATGDLDSFRVSFKYKLHNVQPSDNIWVYYFVDGVGYVPIDHIGTSEEDVWLQYTDVRYNSGADAQFFNGSVTFHMNGHLLTGSDQFVWIDDFEITGYSKEKAANSPYPPDGAAGVPLTADLAWTAGAGALSHDVYFGTNSPGGFQGNQTASEIFDPSPLEYSTTYYWRIDEQNSGGTETGSVWSFTTEDAPLPGNLYAAWAVTFGLDTNSSGAMTFDYEPDGLNNLAEYALGGNPTNADAATVLPLFKIVDNHFYHIHNERTDDTGLTYTVQLSTNLISSDWITNGVELVGEGAFSNVWKTVTNRTDVGDTEFMRLRIERD